eukprot:TRINITY_DN37986_c0_g1_i1.p1 TRINITY_DN37986_c0_g1~~TRINITY_DN37986_c0_g1_i1.p1  ORF type:complete len:245 (-),score=35.03 TRINITY_DN37986_c0_g1_i1:28-762(-)
MTEQVLRCLQCGARDRDMTMCLSRLTRSSFRENYGGSFEDYSCFENGVQYSVLCPSHVGRVGHMPADGAYAIADVDAVRVPKRIKLEHAERLTESLWSMHDQGDFLIKCADGQIRCHSLILAALSPALASMVTCQMKESQTRTLVLRDCEVADVQAFVEFAYTGQLDAKARHAAVLELADKYGIDLLIELCCNKLVSNLCVKTVAATARVLRKSANEKIQQAFKLIEKKVAGDPDLCSAVLRSL